MINLDLPTLIALIPAMLIGLAFHEFAHAWVADYLGDPTPRSQGRLTINPLAHLDIFGTIMILLYKFGWAKPVQINPYNFRGNPLQARMFVSLAGPAMNLIIAFLGMLIWGICEYFLQNSLWWPHLYLVLKSIVTLNIGLAIFNLVPIPPLDGFAVLGGLLPRNLAEKLWSLEPYGILILMVLLFTNILSRPLFAIMEIIFKFYQVVISWALALFMS
ncbi:MAG: site-2 protease family protein [Desulfitobacteriaceae bacterium]|nr:site-2 protease family protein [Clostridia bacterium]MDD4400636.1 site-2 protease family protein [Desulfitobacteriaceae bacterium]